MNAPFENKNVPISSLNVDQTTHYYQARQDQQPSVLQMDFHSRPKNTTASPAPLQLIRWAQRPKFATSFWEEENTFCYQVDANSICVARRQDNDMINGTKLLNVTGMSRGKRDGILKNEKVRVVVKVGPMHLKGVWIPFNRAKEIAHQFKITELLHPLFLKDPNEYFRKTNPSSSRPRQQLNNDQKVFTVRSQSKPPPSNRHHIYPSYDNNQRLQQRQYHQEFMPPPFTTSQPEFQQIPSSSSPSSNSTSTDVSFYQPPPLHLLQSYPPTPTDPSFSFDAPVFSNQQQHEFDLYQF